MRDTQDLDRILKAINEQIDEEIEWRDRYRAAKETLGAACCDYTAQVLLKVRQRIVMEQATAKKSPGSCAARHRASHPTP